MSRSRRSVEVDKKLHEKDKMSFRYQKLNNVILMNNTAQMLIEYLDQARPLPSSRSMIGVTRIPEINKIPDISQNNLRFCFPLNF